MQDNKIDVTKSNADLASQLKMFKPSDIAEFLEQIDDYVQTLRIIKLLSKDEAAEVFANLSSESQEQLLETLSDNEVSLLIAEVFTDDTVDILSEMPANIVKKVLKNTTEERRTVLNKFLGYEHSSAGGVMTNEFISLKKNMSVKSSFEKIKKIGLDKETVYTCYVTDPNKILIGVVSLKTLLLSNTDVLIGDVMTTDVVYAATSDDQEYVAGLFRKYNFFSLPVVDNEKRLVGIITIDDILDVIEQEHTEDIQKMAATLPTEIPYSQMNVFQLLKGRIGWLMFLMVSAFLTSIILNYFENLLSACIILILSVPMLMDTAGNAGAQSSTIIIRSMAVGEVTSKDFFKVFRKEIIVASISAIILVPLAFFKVFLRDATGLAAPLNVYVPLTVSLTMIFVLMVSNIIGGMLPFLAKRLKIDPAAMAAPLVASIMDSLTLIIYFVIASFLVL